MVRNLRRQGARRVAGGYRSISLVARGRPSVPADQNQSNDSAAESVLGCGSRNAGDMTATRAVPRVSLMRNLTTEQQVFVLYQIRNWVFGLHDAFAELNVAWAVHGAQAYFWD